MSSLPFPNRRCWLGLLVVCSGLLVVGCSDRHPSSGASRFQTAVAQRGGLAIHQTAVARALQAGLPVYWLGFPVKDDEMSLDTLDAEYPSGTAGVRFNGVRLHYAAADGRGDLQLSTVPKSEWPSVADQLLNTQRYPDATRRSVTVAGHPADLVSVPLGTRPVNSLALAVDLGDFVVLAQTPSITSSVGEEMNPLIINPDRLVALMEQIRPYPQ